MSSMKRRGKKIITAIFLFAIVCGGVVAVLLAGALRQQQFSPFHYGEYLVQIENYQRRIEQGEVEETYVGPIEGARDARKKAEEIWLLFYNNVKKQKPYQVFYDAENGVWLVKGTLRQPLLPFIQRDGGTAYILFRESDGKVLARGHYK